MLPPDDPSPVPAPAPPPAASPQLQRLIRGEQVRLLFSQMWLTTWVAAGFAVMLAMVLLPAVGTRAVGVWLVLKLLVIVPRLVQARRFSRAANRLDPAWYRGFAVMLAVDGFIWGLAGWWLLPIDQLDTAAVIVASLLGAAALATFTLHTDLRACACLVVPMLLPLALNLTRRHDAFGLFGVVGVGGFMVLLLLEARRSQQHIAELLWLRFHTDRIAQEREQALRLAQRHSAVKSQFLATMSHEMRTPLHGILGLTRQVRAGLADAGARQKLELVERSGTHLLSVINDVLDFSRIEAGRMQVESAPFDLAALLDDVVALSAVTASGKGLALQAQSRLGRPCWVRGDAARVRQVLLNLLGNAVKFTEHGSVTLHAWREAGSSGPNGKPGRVLLSVEDTGIGMPADALAQIFEPFHQLDGADNRRFAGTGLGLAISRELAQAMGGDIVCASQPGRGSTFTLGLPLEPADAPAIGALSEVLDATPPPHVLGSDAGFRGFARPARVLLAEDNPVNALVAEATLHRLGLDVKVVEDGAAAVQCIEEPATGEPFDLVLMDCQMPVMDGFEATRAIRALEARRGQPAVPIVALTASALEGDRERCLAAGMNAHLPKPFHDEQLQALLSRYLGAAGP